MYIYDASIELLWLDSKRASHRARKRAYEFTILSTILVILVILIVLAFPERIELPATTLESAILGRPGAES